MKADETEIRTEHTDAAGLLVYRNLLQDPVVVQCVSVIEAPWPLPLPQGELPEESKAALKKIGEVLEGVIHFLMEKAVSYGWTGNLWQAYLTDKLLNDENAFTQACERRAPSGVSLRGAAARDLDRIGLWFACDWEALSAWLHAPALKYLAHFDEEDATSQVYNRRVQNRIAALKDALAEASVSPDAGRGLRMRTLLEQFYEANGCGAIGLHKAFRVREDREGNVIIDPIRAVPHVKLEDLIGYEDAKGRLLANTEAFLAGRPANNCLLYGDAGTGKSSCIKAITDRYYDAGLRVIEVYKHQAKLLHGIINQIKNRNYRFIIYMDDISFEDFETEYKYLKAVIEGGLEKKPENLLIYATSNRRHLIKERFSDRGDLLDDDIHKNDTVQEKLSLAYRFGVTIYFGAPGKREFEEIVKGLAARAGITMPEEELLRLASRWEMAHGGKSGRSATQFIDDLTGSEGNDARV